MITVIRVVYIRVYTYAFICIYQCLWQDRDLNPCESSTCWRSLSEAQGKAFFCEGQVVSQMRRGQNRRAKQGTKCVSSPWHLSSIEYPSAEAD